MHTNFLPLTARTRVSVSSLCHLRAPLLGWLLHVSVFFPPFSVPQLARHFPSFFAVPRTHEDQRPSVGSYHAVAFVSAGAIFALFADAVEVNAVAPAILV